MNGGPYDYKCDYATWMAWHGLEEEEEGDIGQWCPKKEGHKVQEIMRKFISNFPSFMKSEKEVGPTGRATANEPLNKRSKLKLVFAITPPASWSWLSINHMMAGPHIFGEFLVSVFPPFFPLVSNFPPGNHLLKNRLDNQCPWFKSSFTHSWM